MFAFALWDKQSRTLTLARDRLGEKPLYYGRQRPDGPFLFGSELKALVQHPQFQPEIDRQAVALLLRYLNVPAPFSIYRGIRKLLPGTMATLREDAAEPVIEPYWSALEVARSGLVNPSGLAPEDARDELERRLEHAIGRQMMADVPLGAFLSGGVDSSTVVAIMQKLSSRPVKTFTIGFHEAGYNEAEHAKAVAGHLGTDHSELYVSARQAMDVIPRLPSIYDEPFADSSQIPTYLVSALARQQVTVSLSGDGGDELFGGYNRYLLTSRLWGRISAVPMPLRSTAARLMQMIPVGAWNSLGSAADGLLSGPTRTTRFGEKIHKGAPMLCSRSVDELYEFMLTQWREPPVIGVESGKGRRDVPARSDLAGFGGAERMMAQDMLGYLPDDILAKVDRAAMAVSLETRVPLLDKDIVEFAWSLPLGLKIRGGVTKWIMRQVLYRHVPAALIERPKMGFGVPLGDWLREPLRDWAEALLDERRLREEGFFDGREIRRCWDLHLGGRANHELKLWTVLMFQSWLECHGRGNRSAATEPTALVA